MPTFRIHRMKEAPHQQFRWAPHNSGATMVKFKDYDPSVTLEAAGFYDAWTQLKNSAEPLRIGDVLEAETGELRIFKYVGIELAQWVLPEVRSGLETAPMATGGAMPA